MSWDRKQRGGEQGYYYRSQRIDGRSRKIYVGKGPAAKQAAALDERQRQARQAARDAWQAEVVELAVADNALAELCERTELLASAVLLLQRFHCHHGTWRCRRAPSSCFNATPGAIENRSADGNDSASGPRPANDDGH
jgi:hypothetical protein